MAADLLVTPGWLSDRLDRVRVLDVRGGCCRSEPRYAAYPERYRDGHIPGAVFADWRRDFTDRDAPVPVTARPAAACSPPTPPAWASATTTVVVAYDDYRNALAGRIVWVLRSYGHPRAHLLDGGLRGLGARPGSR